MQCKSLFSAKELEVGFKFDWFAENSHYYIIETTLNSTNCNHAIASLRCSMTKCNGNNLLDMKMTVILVQAVDLQIICLVYD